MVDSVFQEIVNSEPEAKSTTISTVNADTQIMRVAHPDPAAARIKWTKLYIHNTAAAAAEVIFWDEDLTAGAVSTNSKQGSNTAPRFRVTVGSEAQVILGKDDLPGLTWQAGIAARSDGDETLVVVEWAKQAL